MKIKLSILFLVISLTVYAQNQNYYAFFWNNSYGIVKYDLQEIIAPSYETKINYPNIKSSQIILGVRKISFYYLIIKLVNLKN